MTEIEKKQAHGTEIIAAMSALKDLIGSQPDLWFGGVPPIYGQILNMLTFNADELAREFKLPAPQAPVVPPVQD